MVESRKFTAFAAFIATGLALNTFLILLVVCWAALHANGPQLADRMSLVYLVGTMAGMALFYARYEYRNLRLARGEEPEPPPG